MPERCTFEPDPNAPLKLGPCDESLHVWRQLFLTSIKIQRRLEEQLTPHGLVLSQFEALVKIGLKPGMIQQELVEHLLVTKGNVGALIDRLETVGLVERRPDPADRRANRLHLTEAGVKLMNGLLQSHQQVVRDTIAPLEESEKKSLCHLLQRIEPA